MVRKLMGFAAAAMMAGIVCAGQYEEVPFVEGQPMPAAQIGEAWCIYVYPPTYRPETREVLVRPAMTTMTPVAPVYGRRQEEFMCEEAYEVGVAVPPQFGRKEIPVVCIPEHEVLEVVPPRFQSRQVEVEVCPAYEETYWVPATFRTQPREFVICPERKELRKVACVDGTNIDCYTVVGAPAKIETVQIKVVDQPGRVEKRLVPAKTQMVTVQELVEPARVTKRVVPAQMTNVPGAVVNVPAAVNVQQVPEKRGVATIMTIEKDASVEHRKVDAVYRTETFQVLDQPERVVWRKQLLNQQPQAYVAPAPAPVYSEAVAEQVVADYGSVPGVAATRYLYK